jgi:antitoxin component YwqK of YwqJK toxin-antitoxin module
MKRSSLFIALNIFFSSFLVAQAAPNLIDAAGRKQGHWIKYSANKKKLYDGNFVNDVPEGKFIYYSEAGIPWAITVFSQKGTVGYNQHFSAVGKLVGEGKYINQKKDSLWKFYNDEGKLVSVENYLNDLKQGSCKIYYSNGQLSEDKVYVKDLLDGPCTKYFADGKIKYKGQYIKDKVEGKTLFYYPSGTMSVEGFYKNDLKDGTWNFYNMDGTLKKKVLYSNGKTKDKTEAGIMTKEEEEKAKKQYEQKEIKEPNQE